MLATGTNEQKLKNLKEKNYNKIYTEKFKLDDHDKIEEFIDKVRRTWNGIDILVNNAGITMDNLSIRLARKLEKSIRY